MRIKYSCVVDNKDLFKRQGWLWLNSLICFGKINPSDIYIHCIRGVDQDYMQKCAAAGVNVVISEPFGDKTYCNKISQLSNINLKDSDAIILMDTDMIMLENFESTLNYNYINAKIVDQPNPPTNVIDEVFKLANLQKTLPDKSVECLDYLTYGANFNGGLYIIPQKYYEIVKSGWEKWSQWLLINGKPLYDAKREMHIDQISFCMTVHENKIPVNHLERLYNYPLPYDFGDVNKIPYVLHYHTYTDENHILKVDYEPAGNIKKAVEIANSFIREYNR